MSREIIRQHIYKAVEDAKVSFIAHPLIIEYDNNIIVDTSTPDEHPFLCVRIKYLSADQLDFSPDPIHRFWGQIELAAAVMDGRGTAPANRLLDHFYPRLHKRTLGTVRPVRTLLADVGTSKPHLGRVYTSMLIPFWSDQKS